MNELLAVLGTVLLAMASFKAFLVLQQIKRDYYSAEAISVQQLELAKKARIVETDSKYSGEVREFVLFLSDRSFDYEFMQEFLEDRDSDEPGISQSDLKDLYVERFGPHWQFAKHAASNFAVIVLLHSKEFCPADLRQRSIKFRHEKVTEIAKAADLPGLALAA